MDRIKKYHLLCEIGYGATSTVYLGYDPFARREVAIKVASPEILKHKDKGRLYTNLFMNEASLVGKLTHPHIVQIYDAVLSGDLGYIVMEYVSGGVLEKYTAPWNLLPMERVVELVFKCTRALDFANQQGIIHRDIKPANLLLKGDDPLTAEIKISDFGAAIVDSSERTLVSGVGSPAYMSPQQVREIPLDHRTDIYSLGVVMFQLLTGNLPFPGENNYNIIYQIINNDPPLPSSMRKDIPSELDAIVMRAIEKDVDLRYQKWDEFAHDLTQVFRSKRLKLRAKDYAETEKFDTLRQIPFFAAFSDIEIWEVLRFSEWKDFTENETLIQDGEKGDFFCFVVEGELNVIKNNRLLCSLGAGDCFGEMAVINDVHLRIADVVCVTPARIVMVKDAALAQASVACRMNFYKAFLSVLIKRLNKANERLANL